MKIDQNFYKEALDSLNDGVYIMDHGRQIVYWNRGAERITGFASREAVGAHCHDQLLVHCDAKGQQLCRSDLCPAYQTMVQGEGKQDEVFLHHKDGHRVSVTVRIHPLRNKKGKVVGAVEVFSDNRDLREARAQIDELEKMAWLDPLTQIGNRKYVEMRIKSGLSQIERYGWPFVIFFLDVDHFKRVNDTHGHDMGDKALRMVASTLAGSVRSSDVVSRWGGEEFVVMVFHIDKLQILPVGEKMRSLIERSGIRTQSGVLRVTASIGATIARADDTADSLVRRADKLMYQSKAAGRNRLTTDVPDDVDRNLTRATSHMVAAETGD